MQQELAIIDFEASALSDAADPIEVGVAIWKSGGPILTWSSLICRRPEGCGATNPRQSIRSPRMNLRRRHRLEMSPQN